MEESPSGFVVCGGILLQLAFVGGLWSWGRWVAKKHGDRPLWLWMSRAPWIAFLLQVVGLIVTIVLLVRVFGTVADSSPAERATHLANGISNAMNATAFLTLPGYALYAIAIVVFIVGSIRAPAAER